MVKPAQVELEAVVFPALSATVTGLELFNRNRAEGSEARARTGSGRVRVRVTATPVAASRFTIHTIHTHNSQSTVTGK